MSTRVAASRSGCILSFFLDTRAHRRVVEKCKQTDAGLLFSFFAHFSYYPGICPRAPLFQHSSSRFSPVEFS